MEFLKIFYVHVVLILSLLCECHKILVISPLPVKSHVILGNAFVKLLLHAGHEITHISGIPCNISHKRLRRIDINYYYDDSLPSADNPKYFAHLVTNLFLTTLQHESVVGLLTDVAQKFDLVISEWMFNDVYYGLSALYDCPILWFSATESHWMMLRLLEDSINSENIYTWFTKEPPFVSSYLMNDLRLYNYEKRAYENIFKPLMALRGKQLIPFEESKCFESLVLIYLNILPYETKTLPLKFKPIAGYHIDAVTKPLPKNLKSIMDNAKHGVIYFSMGSNLNSHEIMGIFNEKLIDVFSGLKQTVLWKNDLKVTDLPYNVHIREWFPQQSVLAHPNCILFITQGGVLSTTEALHFGVPIVGVPILADQFTNIERAVEKGFAIKVDRTYTMAEDIKEAVNEMLRNPKYREAAEELSSIYHNRSTPPTVELVHWVNEAIRFRVPVDKKVPECPMYKNTYLQLSVIGIFVWIIIDFIMKRFIKKNLKMM